MTNSNNSEQNTQNKKMSLQEAVKQKLANKKQQGKDQTVASTGPTKKLQSQIAKKPSNQRRKMGV